MRYFICFLALTLLACRNETPSSPAVTAPPKAPATWQLPTATEAFHLQSECVRLGEKILDGNLIGSALTQSQVSHYSPRTNRCYVNLTVSTADLKSPDLYMSNNLYDGQTGELLAFTKIEHGKRTGISFERLDVVGTNDSADPDFDSVNAIIDAAMNDK